MLVKIKAFPPKIDEEKALEKLKAREKRLGRLISMELVYMPYKMFIFDFYSRSEQKEPAKAILAVDGSNVQAGFFKGGLEELELAKEIEVNERQILPYKVDDKEALEMASDEFRKRLLKVTMWRRKALRFSFVSSILIYFPYYVGYYFEDKKREMRADVVNALSGEIGNLWSRSAVLKAVVMAEYEKKEGGLPEDYQ